MVPTKLQPAQGAQYTQQFLTNVLSQRGSSSLPYSEDVRLFIRHHLISLISTYSTLQLNTSNFTHNDGRTLNLLQVYGTIPIVFNHVTYNIPIVIWIIENYPRQPPCVHVAPSRDMIIKRPHPYVNPSGVVSVPYLHDWIYPSSNLVGLARNLSHLFTQDPPLYTRQNPNPSLAISSRVSQIPTDGYRKKAMNKLLDCLHSDIGVLRKIRETEMEEFFNDQWVLRQREEEISKGLRDLQEEREGLEQKLQMVLMNLDVLEAWLSENKGKIKGEFVAVNEAFQPCDTLSNQILECTSSDLALEDLIYSLDKAVQEESIPLDQYLKNIRSISREQFFYRATCAKVRSVQRQVYVASMTFRVSQYAI